jgi:glycosyltransferase involved in cell wall biosynthesis
MRDYADSTLPPVCVFGSPSPLGGADTELWHTLRMWRTHGLPVTVVPAWKISPAYRESCEAIGCRVRMVEDRTRLDLVGELHDSIVVSFCNAAFLRRAEQLRRMGCSLVWVNCMTWVFPAEHEHYQRHGLFDHYVFQSVFQRGCLEAELAPYGYQSRQGTLVRAAFCVDEFPFRPRSRVAGEPFVVGRISRADVDKYAASTWDVYRRIDLPIRARLMAWDARIEQAIGRPPEWAECLPANAETAAEFFGKLHCMLQLNGRARENWPRSGLEAMSSGVPIVAQNRWGWREMVVHGETGFLADSDEELAACARQLACDEDLRRRLAGCARRRLEEDLASPSRIWAAWKTVFQSCRRSGGTKQEPTWSALR